ncbi:glycosyltransferase family 25 protein [uncultured Parabacteroides sp.]|uniref:glycosyltransferase family 25 protein n=1 Tax=uncultured Parabacteroides sp. TaxID=512312 RepID=UPI00259AF67D|nr:glycosyltransferase family 25 protein [uncultured Parabacteroides sp.]
MKIKTYLINLKESTARKEKVLKDISCYSLLDVEVVEAVNGKKLTEEEKDLLFDRKRFKRIYSREPLDGEIGCTLSHRECYRRLLASDNEYALILEDDVRFVHPDDVEPVLEKAVGILPSGRSAMILLNRCFCLYYKTLSAWGNFSFHRVWTATGTCAYLVNRYAAKKLLSVDKPFIVADGFGYMRMKGIYIKGIYPALALDDSTMRLTTSEMVREDMPVVKGPIMYRVRKNLLTGLLNVLVRMKILKFGFK